jgi:NADH-quinone oxidoreductase subunit M
MTIEMARFPYLSAILLSCVVGLIVILLTPTERKGLIRWTSAIFSGIALALSVCVFCAFDKTQAGLQFVEKVPWIESLGIQYFNAADGFNLPLILLTGIVHFTGVLTMWELEERVK